jgi:hypothetical protein
MLLDSQAIHLSCLQSARDETLALTMISTFFLIQKQVTVNLAEVLVILPFL